MRVGYVGSASAVGCKTNRKFRLASYSAERFSSTVASNLACLRETLRFNVRSGLLFYRIASDLVPFASHPICQFDWRGTFRNTLSEIGGLIRAHGIRIGMHPGQYTVINSPDTRVTKRSVSELRYHTELLESLGLDAAAKVQIHVGGAYGDKQKAVDAFCRQWERLDAPLKERLAIENDDVRFDLSDCLVIHARIGTPVILDTFHHERLHQGESLREALDAAAATWGTNDGIPMVDYSSQHPGRRLGTHADSLETTHFQRFLDASEGAEFDLMLELRDKEASALRAVKLLGERRGRG